jgi:hypothetical protein
LHWGQLRDWGGSIDVEVATEEKIVTRIRLQQVFVDREEVPNVGWRHMGPNSKNHKRDIG